MLVFIYIIFGYFKLFYPIFILLALCICLPVLIIIAMYLGEPGQIPATENALN